ncbi:putative toxin-antitoxin system toxin component, PIN family [Candidatus Hydrogenedentota bacterium]
MKIVLDTNVLVSGMLTPFGPCGEIVRMLTSGTITLCVDSRILFEYESVLRRPRFKIDSGMIDLVLEHIESTAEACPTVPLPKPLPDSQDEPFLQVAVSGKADYLVSRNLKHFPAKFRCGVRVLLPREFLRFFTEHE